MGGECPELASASPACRLWHCTFAECGIPSWVTELKQTHRIRTSFVLTTCTRRCRTWPRRIWMPTSCFVDVELLLPQTHICSTALTSVRTNLSPFTKDCRVLRAFNVTSSIFARLTPLTPNESKDKGKEGVAGGGASGMACAASMHQQSVTHNNARGCIWAASAIAGTEVFVLIVSTA